MSRRQVKLIIHAAECAALLGNPRPPKDFDEEASTVVVHEFAPAAVIPVMAAGAKCGIKLCTALPGGIAALAHAADQDNRAFVALQMQAHTNDGAVDLSHALAWACDAEPGQQLSAATDDEAVPLTDVLVATDLDNLEVHQDFEWRIPEGIERTPTIEQDPAAANNVIPLPYCLDARVADTAWWIDSGERVHIRWVHREDKKPLLDASVHVHATDNLSPGEGTKFVGVLRTDGLLVLAWDLDNAKPYDHWIATVGGADERIAEALASEEPLTTEERRFCKTIVLRQVTIRN